MSCAWCTNWHCKTDYSNLNECRKPLLGRIGECRLNPEPVATSAVHVCAQFRMNMDSHASIDSLPTIANLWSRLGEDIDERRNLKAEVKRLKKANKDLRAQLRAKVNPVTT